MKHAPVCSHRERDVFAELDELRARVEQMEASRPRRNGPRDDCDIALIATIAETAVHRSFSCREVIDLSAVDAALRQALDHADIRSASRIDLRLIEQQVRKKLDEWRAVLTRNVTDARVLLRDVLEGPITFTPIDEGFRFSGRADLGRLLTGTAINRETVPTGI